MGMGSTSSHPLASVMVSTTLPPQKPLALVVPCPLAGAGDQAYCSGSTPPVTCTLTEASHAPAHDTGVSVWVACSGSGSSITTVMVVSQPWASTTWSM